MPVNGGMGKGGVAQIHAGVLLSHKEQPGSAACTNTYGVGGDHVKVNPRICALPLMWEPAKQDNLEAERQLQRVLWLGVASSRFVWCHGGNMNRLPQACVLDAQLPACGETISEVDLARGSRPLQVGPCPWPFPLPMSASCLLRSKQLPSTPLSCQAHGAK